MKKTILFLCYFSICLSMSGQDKNVILHLNFDDPKEIPQFKSGKDWQLAENCFTKEIISETNFKINGLAKYVPGVKGTAMKFDGFSSFIEGGVTEAEEEENEEPGMPENISIEAWISLGAYPWNWAPIITIGKYKITGFYFGIDSRGRLGFHISDATSVWHECNSELNPETRLGLELKKWYHVVGTYSPKNGLEIYYLVFV